MKVDPTVRRPEPVAVRVFGRGLRGIAQEDTRVLISQLVDLFKQGGS
ncbi:hypothetical protein [Streptomyces sp. NPDC050416]